MYGLAINKKNSVQAVNTVLAKYNKTKNEKKDSKKKDEGQESFKLLGISDLEYEIGEAKNISDFDLIEKKLRRAYKDLAKKHHPDTHEEESKKSETRKFQEIKNAYDEIVEIIKEQRSESVVIWGIEIIKLFEQDAKYKGKLPKEKSINLSEIYDFLKIIEKDLLYKDLIFLFNDGIYSMKQVYNKIKDIKDEKDKILNDIKDVFKEDLKKYHKDIQSFCIRDKQTLSYNDSLRSAFIKMDMGKALKLLNLFVFTGKYNIFNLGGMLNDIDGSRIGARLYEEYSKYNTDKERKQKAEELIKKVLIKNFSLLLLLEIYYSDDINKKLKIDMDISSNFRPQRDMAALESFFIKGDLSMVTSFKSNGCMSSNADFGNDDGENLNSINNDNDYYTQEVRKFFDRIKQSEEGTFFHVMEQRLKEVSKKAKVAEKKEKKKKKLKKNLCLRK